MIPSVFTGFQTRLGYREFFGGADARLRSASFSYVWTEGENEGNCYADHCNTAEERWSVPEETERKPGHDGWVECGCGFYAYNKPALATEFVPTEYRVTGIVELYGKVIVGSLGYRAEKARILALGFPSTFASKALTSDFFRDRLEDNYNVPVMPHDSMVGEFFVAD